LARTLYAGGQTDIATICVTLGISRATLYRALKEHTGNPSATS
jgi:DNA-binding phage protein